MRTTGIILIIFSFFFLLTLCNANKKNSGAQSNVYLNSNDTVKYVGMQTCRQCHSNKYETFIHTGMGLSFDVASPKKSSAVFNEHAIVYDSTNNLLYKPLWQNDSLKIMEYRLKGNDTIHKRIETVAYIIGSGRHTNSHLVNFNGYIYQAPITFYTQNKKWDLAPGMAGGFNSRFARIIESQCMNCHNGLPTMVSGSVNKYTNIPLGIDCERCHGPGSLHVARVSNNILVDTSKEIDYSIVNPKKLPVELQNNLCFRCHLQGVNVLNENASFFDFKPGDKINAYWNIFLPQFSGKNDKFLMASQPERLMQSQCFIKSQKLSCITCHNPHISVKDTPIQNFNAACINCHTPPKTTCTQSMEVRKLNNDNCSGCHIPKSGSVDIPHVSISDHKIQIPGKENQKPEGVFTGLKCMTDSNPSALTMAKGYLTYYEAFNHDNYLLDSVRMWLNKVEKRDDFYRKAEIQLKFLRNDYSGVIEDASKIEDEKNIDAWTWYRTGESYFAENKYADAEKYFQKAVDLMPYNLDYNLKLGSAKYLNGNIDEAEKIFAFIISENPKYARAWYNAGVIDVLKGRLNDADVAFTNSIALDPDYEQARFNLADLYIKTRQKQKAKDIIEYLKQTQPGNKQVQQLEQQLKRI